MNLPVRAIPDNRRRLSIERLALYHVAAVGSGPEAASAREKVTVGELEGLIFGGTFLETLLLSGPMLDLYESQAHVGTPWPGRVNRPFGSVSPINVEVR